MERRGDCYPENEVSETAVQETCLRYWDGNIRSNHRGIKMSALWEDSQSMLETKEKIIDIHNMKKRQVQ